MTGPSPFPCLCHWLFYFPFCLFLPHEHTKCFCHFWESNKLHYWEEAGSTTQRQKSAVFTWMLKAVSHDGKWNVRKSTGWIKRALVNWWVFYRLCLHVMLCQSVSPEVASCPWVASAVEVLLSIPPAGCILMLKDSWHLPRIPKDRASRGGGEPGSGIQSRRPESFPWYRGCWDMVHTLSSVSWWSGEDS